MSSNKEALQAEVDALASALVSALGEGWEVAADTPLAYLPRKDVRHETARLVILVKDETHWTVRGMYPEDLLTKACALGVTMFGMPEAHFARKKSVEQIARELNRRLIPGVKTLQADATRTVAKCNARREAEWEATNKLVALSGGALKLRRSGDSYHRRFYAYDRDGLEMNPVATDKVVVYLNGHVTVEIAEKIAALFVPTTSHEQG